MSERARPARIGFLLSQVGAYAGDLWAAETSGLGITPSEAGVLRLIGRSPSITQRDLAARYGTTQSRIVAIIDGLESAGLATRVRSTSDRRKQHLDVTEKGREMLGALRQAAERQEAAITAGLTQSELETLADLLTSITRRRGLDVDLRAES